jgi:hypothetical protein
MAEELIQSFTGLKINKNEINIMDTLKTIIHKNEYIKNCSSNNKKDPSSLSFLIDKKLSQSDCIKLGNGVEKVLSDIITENGLDTWVRGNAKLAQGIIVELIARLVVASSPKPTNRRFPLGDAIGQHGPYGYFDLAGQNWSMSYVMI